MATSREMTAGPALPLIFNFTMPLLLGNLLQQTYSLVDAAIVGKFLGINALAAVGASSSVIFLILGFCNGCSCGFGIPVAQKFGARDYVMMRRYVAVSLQLSLVMSVMIALITSIYCADILRIMRTPENIFEGAYAYLLVTFIGVPCTFLYNLLSSIIRALGDSKTPFWFLLFSTTQYYPGPFLYSGIEMGSFGSGDRYCFFSGNFCLIVLCIHVQAFSDTERGSQRA